MNKIKLVCFDMEGTIFKKAVPCVNEGVAPSVWEAIARALGEGALREEKETQQKYKDKKYKSYTEWMEETIEIHKKHRLKRETFNKVIDGVDFMPGVEEVFSVLNNYKIPTCLISGGFKN